MRKVKVWTKCRAHAHTHIPVNQILLVFLGLGSINTHLSEVRLQYAHVESVQELLHASQHDLVLNLLQEFVSSGLQTECLAVALQQFCVCFGTELFDSNVFNALLQRDLGVSGLLISAQSLQRILYYVIRQLGDEVFDSRTDDSAFVRCNENILVSVCRFASCFECSFECVFRNFGNCLFDLFGCHLCGCLKTRSRLVCESEEMICLRLKVDILGRHCREFKLPRNGRFCVCAFQPKQNHNRTKVTLSRS